MSSESKLAQSSKRMRLDNHKNPDAGCDAQLLSSDSSELAQPLKAIDVDSQDHIGPDFVNRYHLTGQCVARGEILRRAKRHQDVLGTYGEHSPLPSRLRSGNPHLHPAAHPESGTLQPAVEQRSEEHTSELQSHHD